MNFVSENRDRRIVNNDANLLSHFWFVAHPISLAIFLAHSSKRDAIDAQLQMALQTANVFNDWCCCKWRNTNKFNSARWLEAYQSGIVIGQHWFHIHSIDFYFGINFFYKTVYKYGFNAEISLVTAVITISLDLPSVHIEIDSFANGSFQSVLIPWLWSYSTIWTCISLMFFEFDDNALARHLRKINFHFQSLAMHWQCFHSKYPRLL